MVGSTPELLCVDEILWVMTAETGLSAYDFRLDRFFPCRHAWNQKGKTKAVARVGAFTDYVARFESLHRDDVVLIHDPAEHRLCSELPQWYSLIEDLTPKSFWFETIPQVEAVERVLRWPIFVKGSRQTSRHQRSLSIIDGPESFLRSMDAYHADPILRWQPIVCREFVSLRKVEDPIPERIPSSFEFRTFWWRGEFAGFGPYWWEGRPYHANSGERDAAAAVAQLAASRLNVAFLVVDVAQTADGRWIVIECNDGQESGYAGVSPVGLWQSILAIEKRRHESGLWPDTRPDPP
jgi:ATP-grasp domain, R2K clade family 3